MFNVRELLNTKPSLDQDGVTSADFQPRTVTPARIQREIVTLKNKSGPNAQIFLETVSRQGDYLAILGWATTPCLEVELIQEGRSWPLTLTFHDRDDVAVALGLPSGQKLGFATVTDAKINHGRIELSIALPRCQPIETGALQEKAEISDEERRLLPGLLTRKFNRLAAHPVGTQEWWGLIEDFPECDTAPAGCHGFIEGVFASPEGGGVVFGWALHEKEAVIWLEDNAKNTHPLDKMFRRERRDIMAAFPDSGLAGMEAAFIAFVPDVLPLTRLRLRIATPVGIVTLGESSGVEMLSADPLAVADKLFGVLTEDKLLSRRAIAVDWPLLSPLITKQQRRSSDLSSRVTCFGSSSAEPEVSVIVGLNGSHKAMESQLFAFSKDGNFRDKAELVYVLDDSLNLSDVLVEAELLYRFLDCPHRVVRFDC